MKVDDLLLVYSYMYGVFYVICLWEWFLFTYVICYLCFNT